MKIEPVKNYKKPNYAMRIASIIAAAGSLAGCSNTAQLEGDVSVVETEPATSEVELVGMIEPTEETCVELEGDVASPIDRNLLYAGDFITEEQAEEMRKRKTTTAPAVTTTDAENIAVPGMSLVETEETSPVTNNRKNQTYTTAATTTEVEIDGIVTTATERKTSTVTEQTTMTTTEVMLDGTVPMYTQTTTEELADEGVVTTYTETTAATTTEPELAGDIPIQIETTTTELELAGEPVLPME